MTSKQTEALKLALEALKMCRGLIRNNIENLVPIESPNPWFSQDVEQAIAAIREALAEPPPCKYPHCAYPCPDLPDCRDAEQPAQQPVAWSPRLDYSGYADKRVWANGKPKQEDIEYWSKNGGGVDVAYTSPQPAQQTCLVANEPCKHDSWCSEVYCQEHCKFVEQPAPVAEPHKQPEPCQCPECQVTPHASDCAVHNEPAYPNGACNCRAQPEQEPVAWDNCRSEKQCRSWCGNSACGSHWNDTSPQPSKPLTDEEIDNLPWGPHEGNPMTFAEGLRDFARAIEAAHGIKE